MSWAGIRIEATGGAAPRTTCLKKKASSPPSQPRSDLSPTKGRVVIGSDVASERGLDDFSSSRRSAVGAGGLSSDREYPDGVGAAIGRGRHGGGGAAVGRCAHSCGGTDVATEHA